MPNRNSTTSEPSRRMATATTTAMASRVRPPASTAPPRAFIWAVIALAWRDIQIVCQASMTTAAIRIEALNRS